MKEHLGLKAADSLWTRLLLDLNRAGDIVSHTVANIRELAKGLKRVFSMVYR